MMAMLKHGPLSGAMMKLFLPFLDIVLRVGLSDMIHDEALIVGLGPLHPQGGIP
jgi:hypothetical protein